LAEDINIEIAIGIGFKAGACMVYGLLVLNCDFDTDTDWEQTINKIAGRQINAYI